MRKSPKIYNQAWYILIPVYLLLSSCGNDSAKQQLDSYVKNLKLNLTVEQDKNKRDLFVLPVKTIYQQEKERSPFGSKQLFSLNRIGYPLQRYSLSMLHFVGTLVENGVIYGYILAPDNLLYPVRQGDRVGDHNGIVTIVDTDRIEIMENVNEVGKPVTQRIITLQLKDEP